MKQTTKLRELIQRKEILVAPGAFDALSAKLIEAVGFDAVYMTGFGTAASIFGIPDIGLLTMTEMVENARRISDAVKIPVIADADTGYGNHLNVVRMMEEYEKAGVAGLHIEDQVSPKDVDTWRGKN
jgi:2-methylisocitrate lyase-like PEP mutase family enzyme